MLFSRSSAPLSVAEQRSRLMGLAGMTALLAGIGLYNQGYQIAWLVCPLRLLTGIPCPLCGMTRSFMAVARGNWGEAIDHHAFGPVLFFTLLIAALHWLLELGTQHRIHAFYQRWLGERRRQVNLVAGLLLYYGIRLHGWAASGELWTGMQSSAIGHWLSQ